jgi:NADH-quinone oxidoreductase subunit L
MQASLNAAKLLIVPLAPLVGALLAGIFGTKFGGNRIGRMLTHSLTIAGVLISFIISALTLQAVVQDGARLNETL